MKSHLASQSPSALQMPPGPRTKLVPQATRYCRQLRALHSRDIVLWDREGDATVTGGVCPWGEAIGAARDETLVPLAAIIVDIRWYSFLFRISEYTFFLSCFSPKNFDDAV